MLLEYTDNIDIMGLNNWAISATFSRLEKEAKEVGFGVNEGKIKYLEAKQKFMAFWELRHYRQL